MLVLNEMAAKPVHGLWLITGMQEILEGIVGQRPVGRVDRHIVLVVREDSGIEPETVD